MFAAMSRSTALIVGLLTASTQAFGPSAPIQWMNHVVTPQISGGPFRGSTAPQQLLIKAPSTNTLRDNVPYFTLNSDSSIMLEGTDSCIEATSAKSGSAVRLNRCTGEPAQKWNWIPDNHGGSHIQLKDTDKCLDASIEGGFDGAPVVLWGCESKGAEAWKFQELTPLSKQGRYTMMNLIALVGTVAVSLGALLWQYMGPRKMVPNPGGATSSGDDGGVLLNSPLSVQMATSPSNASQRRRDIVMIEGKGVGVGEVNRDPEPTKIVPNDRKGIQQAIHKAETFASYLPKHKAAAGHSLRRTRNPSMSAPVKTVRKVDDLSEADLKGKRVLIRCDLNVPIKKGQITDDTRIVSSVPTIKYLTDKGAKVIACSHLGRPKDGPEEKFSLKPVAKRLGELMGKDVPCAPDCRATDEVKAVVDGMSNGDVVVLENTRFQKGETKNDEELAKSMASLAEIYVNDAFGSAHRAHASTEGVTKFLSPCVPGFLLAREVEYLNDAVETPVKPMAAIVGGAKVSTKITVIESLLDKVDKLIIGGGMVFTFLKARGLSVGDSMVEEDFVELAATLEKQAKQKGVELILPTDIACGDQFPADDTEVGYKVVPATEIPDGWMGLDNGPETNETIRAALRDCKTILWNGPLGVFESEQFSKGTFDLARLLAKLTDKGAITIIGGGDSVAAVNQSGLSDKMSHISTGGGASLELLEGKVLPGVAALDYWIAEPKTIRKVGDLSEADLKGKRVLIRCDLNVPIKQGQITDDTRIVSSVPTIKYLTDKGAKVIACSHLGRPKDGPEEKFSLKPVAKRLGELMEKDIPCAPDCIATDEVKAVVDGMSNGDVVVLENTRFQKGETKNDEELAKSMASLAEIYVNDAFGSAHRAHSSTEGVTKFLSPCVPGFLLAKEVEYLNDAVETPVRPLAAIVGGAKVSTKITVIESMLDKVDKLIIGGGMVFTFLKARGLSVGDSMVEEEYVELAAKLEEQAKQKGVELILPADIACGDQFPADDTEVGYKVVPATEIPDGWMGLDNGPEANEAIRAALRDCKTILWNGPLGVFESEQFNKGTFDLARLLAQLTDKGAITIIGGGDSVAAVNQSGLSDKMSHISTGGGASLELLEGKVLPGVAALD